MNLSKQQIEQFDRDGYLFLPTLFTPQEVSTLLNEVPALYAQRRAENIREKGSDAVRTNFAAHLYNRQFAKLARHPRMVEPIQKLLGEPVYMHQFKINGKMAFDGDVWQWHQDYGTWKSIPVAMEKDFQVVSTAEAVRRADVIFVALPDTRQAKVYAQDIAPNLAKGKALLFSHGFSIHFKTIVPPKNVDVILVAPKGPAGSMILFHSCLVHASNHNLSPWDRIGVYLSLCAVSNHIRRFKRPGYIAHREFTPIECLPDDCLVKDYDVPLPWKDGTPEEALKPLSAA